MFSVVIFLLLVITVDMCAMEETSPRDFSTSGSSPNVLDSDNSKPLLSTEISDIEYSKKRVLFRKSRSVSSSYDLSSSRSSSKDSQELLKKNSSYLLSPRESQEPLKRNSNNLPSPRELQESLKKSSKSKKDTYQEKQKKEILTFFKNGNTQDIMCLLHPDFNVSDKEGKTPLILAIQNKDNVVVADLLFRKDIDVNKTDKWGNTPLHHATLKHTSVIIKSLLDDCRVDSSIANNDGTLSYKFLDKQFYSDQDFLILRQLFFMRLRLELVVRDIMPTLKGNALDDAVVKIKERIATDGAMQKGHQPLPDEMQKPLKDELIKKVVTCRWVKQGICKQQDTEIRSNTVTHNTETVNGMRNDNALATDKFIEYLQEIANL